MQSQNNPSFKWLKQKMTNSSKEALLKAAILAKKFNHPEIDSSHLLYGIYLKRGSVGSNVLSDFGLTKEIFQDALLNNHPPTKNHPDQPPIMSESLKKIIIKAFSAAQKFNYPYVGTEHLIYAIFDSNNEIVKKIATVAEIKKVGQSLKSLFEPNNLSNLSKMFNLPELNLVKNKTTHSSATPFIDKFCTNISEEAKAKKEIVIGREKEIGRIINILGRKNKNNPLLVGDPGVGKTVLITGLAQLISAEQVPPSLYGKKIMNLDVAQLIAGTSFRGEFEARLKEIIKEASQHHDIILFIDEIHNIVGAGNVSGSLDLANILKPALTRGEIQLIGATTQAEYKKHIEKDAALERRFQPVQINEPTEEEARRMLFGIKGYYETFHNVSISDQAVSLAVELSTRYIQNRFLPDKAIDVIDETASHIRSKNNPPWRIDSLKQIRELENQKISLLKEKEKLVNEENFEQAIQLRLKEKMLSEEIKILRKKQADIEKKNQISIGSGDILETIAKISGIPAEKLSQESSVKIKNIKKLLQTHIIGQKEAIEKLASTLLRSQTGISNPERPLGSFLFLGPTGVGKTLTAKILAQEFFGSAKSLIRIDMSELMERHSVAALIGSPAGYIGYGEGGNLTEKIRRNPYSVVLFDEIEKAHPDIFNILLQILEDGILTDAEGTAVSFKNTIIIMTSNAGTAEFTNATRVGFESKHDSSLISEKFNKIKSNVVTELQAKMRPELLNRLDYILVFNALGKKEIGKIAQAEIEKLKARLLKKNIDLSFGKEVGDYIAEKSLAFDQGARLVRKNIQELIENPIAEMIIYDKVKNGKITVNIEKEEIKLS